MSLAEAASLQLELKYLSHLTGDYVYWRKAERVSATGFGMRRDKGENETRKKGREFFWGGGGQRRGIRDRENRVDAEWIQEEGRRGYKSFERSPSTPSLTLHQVSEVVRSQAIHDGIAPIFLKWVDTARRRHVAVTGGRLSLLTEQSQQRAICRI